MQDVIRAVFEHMPKKITKVLPLLIMISMINYLALYFFQRDFFLSANKEIPVILALVSAIPVAFAFEAIVISYFLERRLILKTQATPEIINKTAFILGNIYSLMCLASNYYFHKFCETCSEYEIFANSEYVYYYVQLNVSILFLWFGRLFYFYLVNEYITKKGI